MTEKDSLLARTYSPTPCFCSTFCNMGKRFNVFCTTFQKFIGIICKLPLRLLGTNKVKNENFHDVENSGIKSRRINDNVNVPPTNGTIVCMLTTPPEAFLQDETQKIIREEAKKREIMRNKLKDYEQDCEINLYKHRKMSGIPSKYFRETQTTVVEVITNN